MSLLNNTSFSLNGMVLHTSQLGGAALVIGCSRGLLTADGGLSLLMKDGFTVDLLAITF